MQEVVSEEEDSSQSILQQAHSVEEDDSFLDDDFDDDFSDGEEERFSKDDKKQEEPLQVATAQETGAELDTAEEPVILEPVPGPSGLQKDNSTAPAKSEHSCSVKARHIPSRTLSVPAGPSGLKKQGKAFSHTPRSEAKLIEPLPQPTRRDKHRGLSAQRAEEICSKESNKSTSLKRSNSRKDDNNAIAPTSFYKANESTMAKGGHRFNKLAGLKNVKDRGAERREKLRMIAEKKGNEAPKSAENKASGESSAKSSVRIKRSEPKCGRFTAMETNKPSCSRRPTKTNLPTIPKIPKSRTHDAADNDSSDSGSASPVPSTSRSSSKSLFLEDVAKDDGAAEFLRPARRKSVDKQRRTAETTTSTCGNKQIAKMRFDNVLTNVASQDLTAQPLPEREALQYGSVSSSSSEKKVRFKEDAMGRVVVEIKEIPKVGLGKKIKKDMLNKIEMSFGLTAKVRPPEQVWALLNEQKSQLGTSIYNYKDMLNRILLWTTTWLDEQEKIKEAPPVQGADLMLGKVPPVFNSYKDYCITYYPLMLQELWSCVYEDYQKVYKDRGPTILCAVTNVVREDYWTQIGLYALISEGQRRNEAFLPAEGFLCRLDLRCARARKEEIRPSFAFVTSARIRKKSNSDEVYAKILHDAKVPKGHCYVLEATALVKRMAPNVHYITGKPIRAKAISRIKPFLRQFRAVDDIQQSALFGSIVQPLQFLLPHVPLPSVGPGDIFRSDVTSLRLFRDLNTSQIRVVKQVAVQCTDLQSGAPHVSLVQGPPGTGKTATIAALILQIFSRWRQMYPNYPTPKIILAAPSNAAVDEIIRRVKKCEGTPEVRNQLKLMRIGLEKNIHRDVQEFRLENLVGTEIKYLKNQRSNSASVQQEIENRQKMINDLGSKIESLRVSNDHDQIALITRKIKEETSLLNKAKQPMFNDRANEALRREATDRLFAYADVIATTLSSAMSGQMMGYFGSNRRNISHFSICIVDEASQCVEPEALIPLNFRGVTKLVMVGDPEQLPATVSSIEGRKSGLSMSLFKRLFRELEKEGTRRGIVHKLDVQYRMHEQIASWPNK